VGAGVGACGGDDSDGGGGGGGSGGSCSAVPAAESGDGTYYDATGGGNCSFDPSPDDLMVAAMNAPDYDNAAWCGACVEVTGPKGVQVVRIVDQCPECLTGSLDLSMEAFAKIADVSAGRVPIKWHEVACDVSGPIAYHHKDGTSQYYTAIQIRNHRYPIAKLEAQTAPGTWTEIPRVDYNYFVADTALGVGPYDLRVTDTRGHVVEDAAVPFAADTTEPGAAQFPTCP
jgi:expansin (peptidoglycan-binding protein)